MRSMSEPNDSILISGCDREFMEMASRLAEENVDKGGGPFGAVIVRGGKVLATGGNTVTIDNDPTAHAEVNAIRNACRGLGSFNLAGAVIYSSCEPCPMCLSAIYWAGLSRLYYGNTQEDADAINFSDRFIYRELERPKAERMIPAIRVDGTSAIRAFEKWAAKEDKTEY